MSSTMGHSFRISTWGESHGVGVGVVIDGVPPRLALTREMIQAELDRRRPGQSHLVTPRNEADQVEILSGVLEGLTLGTPLALLVRNEDHRSSAYNEMEEKFRPSHADYTYQAKYGIRAAAGGGRASARETIGRVAAGAVAKAVLLSFFPDLEVLSWVSSVKNITFTPDLCSENLTLEAIESHPVRCPDADIADCMQELILEAKHSGNSVGGTIQTLIKNPPVGLGEPIFDKLEASLAFAMLSIPATKGFEFGSGFEGTLLTGKEHNDAFYAENGRIKTRTNHSGGIQGGISNGEPIYFRTAFKPTATIMHAQETVTSSGEATELTGKGRHDACVLPRAVPVVDAMVWLVLCDHYLRQRAQCGA